jgi:hypothetical protein
LIWKTPNRGWPYTILGAASSRVHDNLCQESNVNQPTKAIRLGGCAAASFVVAALLIVGCGGPEGAGTVSISAAKEAAASRGLPDTSERLPVAVNPPDARRGNASVAPVKPQRQGHR